MAGSVSQECAEQGSDGRHLDDDGGEDERVSQEVIDEERQRVGLVPERGEAAEESPAVAPEMPPPVADQIDGHQGGQTAEQWSSRPVASEPDGHARDRQRRGDEEERSGVREPARLEVDDPPGQAPNEVQRSGNHRQHDAGELERLTTNRDHAWRLGTGRAKLPRSRAAGGGTTLPRAVQAPAMEVFGSSGTRGVANETLTPEFVVRVAKAAGTTWGADRVALGRDTRKTGPMLADAAASGLASIGADVDRLGVLPTPALQAYAEAEGVPGLIVTASHNPAPYNGIKLVGADGIELAVDAMERVEDTFLAERYEPVGWDSVGRSHRIDGARERYRRGLLDAVDTDAIEAADLTVAVDPGHGAGALTSPQFFRELGCRVVTVHAQADGRFPGRDPEPVEANLSDLKSLVRAADADVGIAHDGDADRAILVDETGAYIEGDATLAALAADCLEPGDVTVSAVNVSQRLVDVVEEHGAELELTPIGSTRIVTRVQELRTEGAEVPIAGEGNGGLIFPEYRLARDGAYTAARFLERCVERPASELVADHGGYHNVRYNIEYDSEAERRTLVRTAEGYARSADAELTTIDGYRLDYGDAWVLARPSGTEPLVRIYAEARDHDRARELADDIRTALVTAIEDA